MKEGLKITPVQKYGKKTNVLDNENARPMKGINPAMQPVMIEHIRITNLHLPFPKRNHSHAKQSQLQSLSKYHRCHQGVNGFAVPFPNKTAAACKRM